MVRFCVSLLKDEVMVLVFLFGFNCCGRSLGVQRRERPNAELALREVMKTDVEKDQKISCRVLQDPKEASASDMHEDLEKLCLQWSWNSRAPCSHTMCSYTFGLGC